MNANMPPHAEQPPSGGSPYAQQPPPPPLPGSSGRWGPTTMGIDPAIAAGLAYLFGGHFAGILPIIWLVVEKRNRFIRFNAAQALLLIAAFFIGMLVCAVIIVAGVFLSFSQPTPGRVLVALGVVLAIALMLALLVLDIWGIVAGFSGKFVKFPLVGQLAVRAVGGPPVPLY